jgi:YfiH family protein
VIVLRAESGPVAGASTTREGGSSVAPFDSLNLGGHVGDAPEVVESNRVAVAKSVGVPRDRLHFMKQCHGSEVHVVDAASDADAAPPVDGLVTAAPGVALAALVADCTPVLLADAHAGVVGAVHAGRPGMMAGIVHVAVARMRELGARDLTAVVGPSVCGRCYEVPADLRAEAAAVVPESATVSWTGTPAFDVAAGVVAQLRADAVAVQWVPGCSREDPRLYSYRRDGLTGRFAGVVVLAS